MSRQFTSIAPTEGHFASLGMAGPTCSRPKPAPRKAVPASREVVGGEMA
jgi:hypothetical protein